MLITLSGVTGTGKSFFKNIISQEFNFKNLVIVTTRDKRIGEKNGIDKEFVSEKKFEELKKAGEIVVDFEFLGSKYAYRKNDLKSNINQVTEVHYNTIYELKKNAKNVYSIYMMPKDLERAKQELRNRKLDKDVEIERLKEIDEHIKEYKNNKELQKQFDCVFINDYSEKAKKDLLEIIERRLKQ